MGSLNIDVAGSDDFVKTDFENIPNGWYLAHAIEGDLEEKGKGLRLNLTWEILDGTFAKRRVWMREWAAHENPASQEIGQRMIRTIGAAIGLARVDASEQLLFKPIEIRVGLSKKEEGYEQRNEVKSARARQAGAGAPASSAQPAQASASKPWERPAA